MLLKKSVNSYGVFNADFKVLLSLEAIRKLLNFSVSDTEIYAQPLHPLWFGVVRNVKIVMAGMDVPALSESGSDSGSDSEYEEEMIILAAQAAVLAASTSLDFLSLRNLMILASAVSITILEFATI